MPAELQPVALEARSSNAKETAWLQKCSETALEYRTCADIWWAFESQNLQTVLMLIE